MSFILPRLESKRDVDRAIKGTVDKVLVLRFGKEIDPTCMQLDDIVSKSSESSKNQHAVSNMAVVFIIDSDAVSVYTRYFDITIFPSTVFFFNGQHMKVDWGTADHTKFVGSFKTSQDFIDVVEVIYRGAMKGKLIVTSPLDPANVSKYSLLYKDI